VPTSSRKSASPAVRVAATAAEFSCCDATSLAILAAIAAEFSCCDATSLAILASSATCPAITASSCLLGPQPILPITDKHAHPARLAGLTPLDYFCFEKGSSRVLFVVRVGRDVRGKGVR